MKIFIFFVSLVSSISFVSIIALLDSYGETKKSPYSEDKELRTIKLYLKVTLIIFILSLITLVIFQNYYTLDSDPGTMLVP